MYKKIINTIKSRFTKKKIQPYKQDCYANSIIDGYTNCADGYTNYTDTNCMDYDCKNNRKVSYSMVKTYKVYEANTFCYYDNSSLWSCDVSSFYTDEWNELEISINEIFK